MWKSPESRIKFGFVYLTINLYLYESWSMAKVLYWSTIVSKNVDGFTHFEGSSMCMCVCARVSELILRLFSQ